MEGEKTRIPPPRQASVFVPSLLVVIALLVMTGFQTIQLSRERELMNTRIIQQVDPLKESETVRKQWNDIRAGTIQLAQQGNLNAKRIVERLLQTGLLRVKNKENTE